MKRVERRNAECAPRVLQQSQMGQAFGFVPLNEQDPNFRSVLEIARALREQVDWQHVRARVDESPFGAAFMTLVERLRIASDSDLRAPAVFHLAGSRRFADETRVD